MRTGLHVNPIERQVLRADLSTRQDSLQERRRSDTELPILPCFTMKIVDVTLFQ
jgi:hypothetical protein